MCLRSSPAKRLRELYTFLTLRAPDVVSLQVAAIAAMFGQCQGQLLRYDPVSARLKKEPRL